MSTISLLVGGEHRQAAGGKTFQRRNPLDGQVATMAPAATTQGTDRSIWPSRMTSIMPVAMTPRNDGTLSCCSR